MKKNFQLEEHAYIVGIHIGYQETTVSFIEHHTLKPVIYDMSGGYGSQSMPTQLLFHPGDGMWLIGDDLSIQNDMDEYVVIPDLLGKLLRRDKLVVAGLQYEMEPIICKYIDEILNNFKHLDPYASFASITIALPDKFSHFTNALEKSLLVHREETVRVITVSEAITYQLFYEMTPKGKYLIVGYDSEGPVASAVTIDGESASIKSLISASRLCLSNIENVFEEALTEAYKAQFENLALDTANHIKILTKKYFPLIFQKYAQKKTTKVYYNFCVPPFCKSMTHNQVSKLISRFEEGYKNWLGDLRMEEYSSYIPYGQGFKMNWPIEYIKDSITIDNWDTYGCIAKGCAWMGYILESKLQNINVLWENPEIKTYGLMITENEQEFFAPIGEGAGVFESMWVIDFEQDKVGELKIFSKKKEKCELEKTVRLQAPPSPIVRLNLIVNTEGEEVQVEYSYLTV